METEERRDRLNSWKAIAAYLDRSVRTVRRWEAGEGLPVHRHMHASQGSVFAFADEIDKWLARRSQSPAMPAPEPDSPALAVLPFDCIGPSEALRYAADGIGEELLCDLARIGSLRVLSRTSSRLLGQDRADARSIGRRHGVTHLVEGTIQAAGPRVRIGVRLIDVEADRPVWSEVFTGDSETLFELQAEVAHTTKQAVSGRLAKTDALANQPQTPPPVWRCLAIARQESLKWRRDAIDNAIRQLDSGLEAFGESPELLAALGRAHLQYREAGVDLGPAPLDKARSALERLQRAAPGDVPTLQLQGWLHYAEGRTGEAIDALIEADRQQPDDAETLGVLINCLLISDRADEAMPHIKRLMLIDPLTPLTACLPGWYRVLEGDFEGALPYYREMLERDPANPMARLFNLWVMILADQEAALRRLASESDGASSESPPDRIAAFLVEAFFGNAERAGQLLGEDIEALASANDILPRFLADGFALLGDADSAARWIDVAVERGFLHYPFLAERNRLMTGLAEHPAIRRAIGRLRQRWAESPAGVAGP